ncbi:hypothetical protein A2331_02730 [Candidatus Falkowbacteria bacterium RIFOXYB2_FULL_34_18]|uniref:Glycosyltransferase 2-like domain-containing protein n=1 Tax=Candidatus Falkowbacteria bacterium RIFOXYD2_FULL_34_120 TaxID=1798007 RepID=A0A1F5TS98_9BACT|nr:MAG: hypothetical protein A2331_02730 [Candidatus Falkowbacteria bacterium RIFOXYB2_FULL_34_18]OGF29655.1 MAG: hypothetical protein A2500_00760 [Candidatus Falkowbacteria bacterium RIFOXYC12_FULL_34_55]OGF37382.1 MAG: hypothetical protein A2466_01530 [Candidatus Falkowbacteria bacterium RIFOXYC2_FULL_34_220]OGF39120.1 MAG: hypothetical protein A2515_00180 [Candidatus Falkowbacteria bacterium RIFOXYD12_FULL_34_57]OGF41644.1 MAG: hypothetical protein A2531_06415 [Candidatus Falkowbacteria bact
MENKNQQKLSIIIPCYNCETTLEEALRSVYTQNFTTPFEVVMVDDGSTDNTLSLIKKLVKKYPHTKYYTHKKNRGGGAARNTGIKKSTGGLIFILDSDDMLPDNMLPKTIDYLNKKRVDGILFEEARYFTNDLKKSKNIKHDLNYFKDIKFNNLFENKKGFLTQVNFLYTKKSFLKTGGYPENHGFDTQHFGFKYLSTGAHIDICPNSYYFHRQANKKSYFERVYEKGEFSKNFYLILEDEIFLFSPEIIKKIIHYDIFKNTELNNNIKSYLNNIYQDNPNGFFRTDMYKYLNPNGFEIYYQKYKNNEKAEDIFCLGIYHYKKQNYNKALDCFKQLIGLGGDTKIVYFNILRSLIGLSQKYKTPQNETETIKLINSLDLTKQKPLFTKKTIFSKIKNKLKKLK